MVVKRVGIMGDRARLAVDIGGTFTDLVLSFGERIASVKVLTTPEAPERGVLDGVRQIIDESGCQPSDIALVIHGTTLATNALIERKGARTALIATDGFRDSVEMAYEHRFEQYDLYMERPSPLVPRYWRFGIPERIAADGEVLLPLDRSALADIVPRLLEANIESLAVGFLHSYANPDHEQTAGAFFREQLPGVAVTLSSDVCPEIREYERLSTACANAYVQPLMAGYLAALDEGLAALGLSGPLLLMMSSGGVTTVDTAIREPIRLVESGPAGGVILAQRVASECRVSEALSFDMGGTTAKLTLIDNGEPQHSRAFEVAREYRFLKGSGLPIRIPVIDMVEIGAGGGSIARLDAMQRITVGPDSAGAMPGPACYDQGGSSPTVTDADVVLGRIDPAQFAGGKIVLDADRATNALATDIASGIGVEPVIAAAGVAELVDETMASAARVHAVENGKDTVDRCLIATGGAAPLHAARLAEKLGIDQVIVPWGAGVGSAHGFLAAPIAYEVVRTRFMRLEAFEPSAVNGLFDTMRSEAERVVRLGAPDGALVEKREAFMRYRGQGHEITVPLPDGAYDAEHSVALRTLFDTHYEAIFGRTIPGLEVEVITWVLTLATVTRAVMPVTEPAPKAPPTAIGTRLLFDPRAERSVDAAVYERTELMPGMSIDGPAVVVETETATVVPTSFSLRVTASGHLSVKKSKAELPG